MGRYQVVSGLPFIHERVLRGVYSDRLAKLRVGYELEVSVNGAATKNPVYQDFVNQFSYTPAANELYAAMFDFDRDFADSPGHNNPVRRFRLVPRFGFALAPKYMRSFERFQRFCIANRLDWSGNLTNFTKKVGDLLRSIYNPALYYYGVPDYDERRDRPIFTTKPYPKDAGAKSVIDFLIACNEFMWTTEERQFNFEVDRVKYTGFEPKPETWLTMEILTALLDRHGVDATYTRDAVERSISSFLTVVKIAADRIQMLTDPLVSDFVKGFDREIRVWKNNDPNRSVENDTVRVGALAEKMLYMPPEKAEALVNHLFSSIDQGALADLRDQIIADEREAQWKDYSEQDDNEHEDSRLLSNIENAARSFTDNFPREPMVIHAATGRLRDYTKTVLMYDKSIKPTGTGVEVVGPTLDYDQSRQWLTEKLLWIDRDPGLSTTNTTGLHANISVKKVNKIFSVDSNGEPESDRLDLVKLVLFLGDRFLLDQFRRTANPFAEQVTPHLRKALRNESMDNLSSTVTVNRFIERMNETLINVLGNHKNYAVSPIRFFKPLTPEVHIEFRVIGGVDYQRKIAVINRTVTRFAQLMVVATDPHLFRREYMTALYKMMAAENPK